VHSVADGDDQDTRTTYLAKLTGIGTVNVRHWCRQWRGLPGAVDLALCRDMQRLMDANGWLETQCRRHAAMDSRAIVVDNDSKTLDRLFLLWQQNAHVTRVLSHEHFVHLLAALVVDGAGAIYIDGVQLTATPLLTTQRRGWNSRPMAGGGGRHRIETIEQYRRNSVQWVLAPEAWDTDAVVRFLRNVRFWTDMCGRLEWDYADVTRRLTESELPRRVWTAHCVRMGKRTWDEYHRCSMGDTKQHWLFGDDAQMASDVCALYECGLMVVDARGTGQHTPRLYSDEELALVYDDADEAVRLRAYVRMYVPSQLLQRLTTVLPADVLWFCSHSGVGYHVSLPRIDADGNSYLHSVGARSSRTQ
jgi:hypothetical protein